MIADPISSQGECDVDPNILAGVPLFDGVPEDEMTSIAAMFEDKRVFMGERFTEKDDFGYSFFVVVEGAVRVDREDGTSRELDAPEFFGEVALVNGSRRTATVTATQNCRVARMMTWDFDRLLSTSPTVGARIKAAADERAG